MLSQRSYNSNIFATTRARAALDTSSDSVQVMIVLVVDAVVVFGECSIGPCTVSSTIP